MQDFEKDFEKEINAKSLKAITKEGYGLGLKKAQYLYSERGYEAIIEHREILIEKTDNYLCNLVIEDDNKIFEEIQNCIISEYKRLVKVEGYTKAINKVIDLYDKNGWNEVIDHITKFNNL